MKLCDRFTRFYDFACVLFHSIADRLREPDLDVLTILEKILMVWKETVGKFYFIMLTTLHLRFCGMNCYFQL